MDDDVLAYFSWLRAHEDEAERAVRAGLTVSQAVSKLQIVAGHSLPMRIGIAAGQVAFDEVHQVSKSCRALPSGGPL